MNNFLRLLFYSVISLFIYSIIPMHVFASGEFQADYDVQYAISPRGTTIVTQNVTLTNKQTNYYPQKYSIVIDSTNIKNVIAYDSKEIVQTDISQKEGKTEILLTFNDKVVGLGKQLPFTLRFENGDIAQRNGKVWEVNVPGIVPDADISSYNVTLSVPQSFGPNAYMTPMPAAGSRWTRPQMMAGGISAAYGTSQSFDAGLSYYIENNTIAPSSTEIAIPPDTAYQTVVIKSLEPRPKAIARDIDGNWMARYDLLPGERKSIEAKLHIDVTIKPKEGYTDDLTDPSVYLQPQKYWESESSEIADLAKKYSTPHAIYQYVVSTLSYDYQRVQQTPIRKGALQALLTPKNAICMEFTDLFIAMARAAGIPAREAVGFAYTTNSKLRPLSLVADVLHAWPEYYDADKQIWVPVDPTWASTTGGVNYFDKTDFNHIVFAVHGKSSEYPYPAGFYRKSGKQTRDVSVTFATAPFTMPAGKLTTTVSFPKLVTAGLTTRGTVTVENKTGVAIPEALTTIQSSPVDVALINRETRVPPYGRFSVPLSLTVPNYFSAGKGQIAATVNGEMTTFIFDIQPITRLFLIPVLSFGGILIILLGLAIGRVHLWRKRRARH